VLLLPFLKMISSRVLDGLRRRLLSSAHVDMWLNSSAAVAMLFEPTRSSSSGDLWNGVDK